MTPANFHLARNYLKRFAFFSTPEFVIGMGQTSRRASVAIQSRPDASIGLSSGNDVTEKRSVEGRSFGSELKKVTKQQEQTHQNSTVK